MSWAALARGHTDAGSGLEKSLLSTRKKLTFKDLTLSRQKLTFQDLTPVVCKT
jgi:hypothetical protein